MISRNNTKTLRDLIVRAGDDFENSIFYRYEKDDQIYEKGYGTFVMDTLAMAAYFHDQSVKYGHATHVAILGKCSYEYLTVLMGAPCGGAVAIPLDVQANVETMIENIEKADTDILVFNIFSRSRCS